MSTYVGIIDCRSADGLRFVRAVIILDIICLRLFALMIFAYSYSITYSSVVCCLYECYSDILKAPKCYSRATGCLIGCSPSSNLNSLGDEWQL